ncbi:hypothetical protein LEMLEM_LOCUS13555 [Lemmus lemmus]
MSIGGHTSCSQPPSLSPAWESEDLAASLNCEISPILSKIQETYASAPWALVSFLKNPCRAAVYLFFCSWH